jgi:protein O-GlcNAc transferase
LPVLTQIGGTFAGRVAASLLSAIGLSELIVSSEDEYENLAVELAAEPSKLAEIKEKMRRNRLTKPLFNTELFTRHLESAFEAMYHRYRAGLAPAHIAVQELKL